MTLKGRTFTEIYYGHTFPDPAVVGHHVSKGSVIGHTGGLHSGGSHTVCAHLLAVFALHDNDLAAPASSPGRHSRDAAHSPRAVTSA